MQRRNTVIWFGRGVVLLAMIALLGSCEGVMRLRQSLEWLTEVNQHEGSLVRSYGLDGNDEFVAIVQPPGPYAELSEGFLAIGHSDSWRWNSSLWILAIDANGAPQNQLLFEGGGVEIVDAERVSVGGESSGQLVIVGNATDVAGDLIIVQIDFDTLVVTSGQPAADAIVHRISDPSELVAADLLCTDLNNAFVVGSSAGHPMILCLDLSVKPPDVRWEQRFSDAEGDLTSVVRADNNIHMACGTVASGQDRNVLVTGLDSDGAVLWAREFGDSSSQRAGAMMWMGTVTGDTFAFVGTSDENNPTGWVFHSIEEGGEHQASTFMDLSLGDYSLEPPRTVAARQDSSGMSCAEFAGAEATVIGMIWEQHYLFAAMREPDLGITEYTLDFVPSVTLTGVWAESQYQVLCGHMNSAVYGTTPPNNDGVIIWPLDDGTSYPANLGVQATPLNLEGASTDRVLTPEALICTVTEVTDWTLNTNNSPDMREY
ncbi:MAG: hypothetical protein KAU31_05465 [Spirochaetaceae bacterium]|nr:hypothetical protein [Spirochaetaceae bacterium]